MIVPIKGKLIDCYERPPFENKATGEVAPIKYALQVLVNQLLNNGVVKKELIDITIKEDQINEYKQQLGKDIELNCKLYSKSGISLSAI